MIGESKAVHFYKFKYKLALPFCQSTSVTGYEVHTDYAALHANGDLYVNAGYCWDGPSGPTIDDDASIMPSLPHDVFYQFIREKLLPLSAKPAIDAFLRTMCLRCGMTPSIAWAYEKAVIEFGRSSCVPGATPKIYVSPKLVLPGVPHAPST